jgi:ABC-type multidrug transport system ATPase subunit
MILIEHTLEHIIPLADRMVLLGEGKVLHQAPTRDFFEDLTLLREQGVQPPGVVGFSGWLRESGRFDGKDSALSIEEAVEQARIAGGLEL